MAEAYASLKSTSFDPAPYAAFIRECGGPAVELGCGDGDPLLALRREGLDVDGVDSSADMLDRCRRRAAAACVDVTLHHQRMEALDLPRRYRAVFLAGPTFCLLPDDAVALAALRGIARHLEPDGEALVPLFTPSPTPAEEIGEVRTATAEDGAELRFSLVSETRDESARTQTAVLRYERLAADGRAETVERPWTLHWFTPEVFTALAAEAGLKAASTSDGFRLRPASSPS